MVNKLLHWSSHLIIPFIFFSLLQCSYSSLYGHVQVSNADTILVTHSENAEVAAQHQEESHSGDMSPLFFLIMAIFIGAATRHFLKKIPVPYTVLLLVIGLGLGLLSRLGHMEKLNLGFLSESIQWAGNINPHIILYVFLPILVFDAAFALDVHIFKKTFVNATLLAVPGILIALVITAAIVILIKLSGIGIPNWTWQMALMFGAVVSATDPVAVTAILKELGASKKLVTVIESESMLNDGTAIVFFMVFFAGITGAGGESSPVMDFFRVSLGGALVGLTIAWITITWVKKVFNDALVEISILIGAAFITFFAAEHFLHVSGVIGLVTFGIMMAGVGRTRLSPQVEHFLHEFWELFAFIANTLIFVIVGVVIANRVVFTATDFLILILLYIGINIARVGVIGSLFPIMKRSGYGMNIKDTYILLWGALRGGIALVLALIVAGEESIDANIRNQFLFYTAGLVTLTLLINATTIKVLLVKLGMADIPPAKQKMMQNAKSYLRQSTETTIDKLKEDRFLNRANWDSVRMYLPEEIEEIDIDLNEGKNANLYETRRRVLEKEKSSYWNQFKEGMLGPIAVKNLTDAINEIIDQDGKIPLSERKDLEQLWYTPKFLGKLQSVPIIGKITQQFFFDRLVTSYDAARGFVEAQYESLKLLEGMILSSSSDELTLDQDLATIEAEINENRIHGLTFLRNLKNTYPEIYDSIATRQAIRSTLNSEHKIVERLLKKGQIGEDEADKMIESIEERMKRLIDSPPEVKPLEKGILLQEISWLAELDKSTFNKIVNLFQERIYAVGEKIIKEHGQVDGLYVIARGSVKVTINNKLIDILGKGSVIGEISVLTSIPRTATVTAESPVTVLRLTSVSMQQVVHENNTLEDKLWQIAAPRLGENIIQEAQEFKNLQQNELRRWLAKGELITAKKVRNIDLVNKIGILIAGKAIQQNDVAIDAPCIIKENSITLSRESRLLICNKIE